MNILLLWPFIHPNLYPVLVSFKEYGFNVTLVIENEPNTIYEIPSKKIYVTASSIDNDSQFIKDIKPDFVLVRKKSPKYINILKKFLRLLVRKLIFLTCGRVIQGVLENISHGFLKIYQITIKLESLK